jgi:hypothetical protein
LKFPETNEKPADPKKPVSVANKRAGKRKREEAQPVNPRGREALEEFRQKCGIGLTQKRITELRLCRQVRGAETLSEYNLFEFMFLCFLRI